MHRLFSELRRRHVFRVAALYAVVAWVGIQVAVNTFPYLQLPGWLVTAVIALFAIGFPVALVLAYAFDVTPEGIERTPPGIAATVAPVDARGLTAAPSVPPAGTAGAGTLRPVNEPSVAVLPFANLSSNPENDYFSDGITEEILAALSRLDRLRVASRTSSFAFKGTNTDVGEVVSRLGVDSVLEGSVRRVGDRVRITAQLVDGSTGFHRWSRTFDREISDIFAVQAEIAREIVEAFQLTVTDRERRAIYETIRADPTAYDFYLRGRHYFQRLRRVDLEHASAMFRRATEADPGFARAYAGLADTLAFLYLWFRHDPGQLEAAEAASRRALELEPESATAHVSFGHVLSLKRQFEEAEAEFERALELDPNLFEAYYLYARASQAQGKLREAARLFGKAHRVRPEDYQSVSLQATSTRAAGEFEEAGRIRAEAVRVIDLHLDLHPDDVRAVYMRAHLFAESGDTEQARVWGERAGRMEPTDPSVTYNLACLEAKLHNPDAAMEMLARTVEQGFIHRDWLVNDPDFDGIRDDPRFQALVERLG
jgi:adenylate cyclase